MGFQQSLIQFNSKENLIKELKNYDVNGDYSHARVYTLVEVTKPLAPFNKEGEILVVLGGERYAQRNIERIKEYIGLDNIKELEFIDCSYYVERSNGDLGNFLDEHFRKLSDDEVKELLGKEQ